MNLKNRKIGVDDGTGWNLPRCYWSKGNKKQCPSVLIKCGDCEEKLRIYYGGGKKIKDSFEINGVLGSKKFWQALFKKIGLIE